MRATRPLKTPGTCSGRAVQASRSRRPGDCGRSFISRILPGVRFMVSHQQRHGRVYYWIVGLLAIISLGLLGYRWWTDQDYQSQNNERIQELRDAKLDAVGD